MEQAQAHRDVVDAVMIISERHRRSWILRALTQSFTGKLTR